MSPGDEGSGEFWSRDTNPGGHTDWVRWEALSGRDLDASFSVSREHTALDWQESPLSRCRGRIVCAPWPYTSVGRPRRPDIRCPGLGFFVRPRSRQGCLL